MANLTVVNGEMKLELYLPVRAQALLHRSLEAEPGRRRERRAAHVLGVTMRMAEAAMLALGDYALAVEVRAAGGDPGQCHTPGCPGMRGAGDIALTIVVPVGPVDVQALLEKACRAMDDAAAQNDGAHPLMELHADGRIVISSSSSVTFSTGEET